MKNLQKILPKLSEMNPERLVSLIFLNGVKPLQEPKLTSKMICPACQGRDGHTCVNDPNAKEREYLWICANPSCVSQITKNNPVKAIQTKPRSLNLEAFGCLPEHANASFMTSYPIQNEYVAILKKYSLNPMGFVYIYGDAGVGKTYLACATLHAIAQCEQNLNARFVALSDLFFIEWSNLRSSEQAPSNLIEKYVGYQLLILDDIGLRAPPDAFLEFLYAVINRRLGENKATIFTTNLQGIEMLEKFGQGISSRITSGITIKISGKDKRRQKGG